MIKYSGDFISKINNVVSSINLDPKFSIDFSNQCGFVLRNSGPFNIETDWRISSSSNIYFVGHLHSMFNSSRDFESFLNFHKIDKENFRIKRLFIDFDSSTLNVEFLNYKIVLFPNQISGWMIFLKQGQWIECIENGGIEAVGF